ncbi:MAG: nucleotidyltransferase domain-containing protein, partial [Bacteroidota bacterium]
ECISGSQAYGLQIPGSDIDLKGVFVMPAPALLGLKNIPQISENQNNEVFYELGRLVELLLQNNPNLLELLATPADCIRYRHPLFDRLKAELFLSKLCEQSFAGYAQAQIRKARGMNKKILNPQPRERKGMLDFAYVPENGQTRPLKNWLSEHGFSPSEMGLVKLGNIRDLYAMYHDGSPDQRLGYKGLVRKVDTQSVVLSSVPKSEQPVAYLYVHVDGYSQHCKQHKAYWEWVEKRNELRYQDTLDHGKNYDAKNMMHTFRLLHMAEEIGRYGEIRVRRSDRELLLRIRKGEFSYDYLVDWAEEKLLGVKEAFQHSSLPESPDEKKINDLLVEIRSEWYGWAVR